MGSGIVLTLSFQFPSAYHAIYVKLNKTELNKITHIRTHIFEVSRDAEAQNVTVNRLIVGSIPTRGDEIFT